MVESEVAPAEFQHHGHYVIIKNNRLTITLNDWNVVVVCIIGCFVYFVRIINSKPLAKKCIRLWCWGHWWNRTFTTPIPFIWETTNTLGKRNNNREISGIILWILNLTLVAETLENELYMYTYLFTRRVIWTWTNFNCAEEANGVVISCRSNFERRKVGGQRFSFFVFHKATKQAKESWTSFKNIKHINY